MAPTTDISMVMRHLSFPSHTTNKLSFLGSPFSITTFARIHYHEKSSWFPAEMSQLLDVLPDAKLTCEAMADFLKRLRNILCQCCKISDYSVTGCVQSQSFITTPVLKEPEGC